MLEKIFLCAFAISIIQYYIYTTNVVWEYLSLFEKVCSGKKLKMLFNGILMIRAADGQTNYISYINSIYNNFFTRLISCPVCTGFWLSIISSLFIGNVMYFGFIAYLSLCLYLIIKILTNKASKI